MNEIAFLPADWPAPAGVVAGTTCRDGGVSRGAYSSLNLASHVGDDPAAVAVNRKRASAACGFPSEPRWLRQVHGKNVLRAGASAEPAEADAIVASGPGVVCAVLTADCLPVVFASRHGNEVAAAHAGWRGLAAGVLEATVSAMNASPGDLLAWLGPAISQAAFEVGAEVRAAFLDADPGAESCFRETESGRWLADLYALARRRLAACGLEAVYGGGHCTYAEPETWFSYRRDGECGRMATFIYCRLP